MAVRDRNLFAWQAYVITMAFVSVGLLLGMFFLWRSYSDISKKYTEQGTRLTEASQKFTLSEQQVDRLLSMLGKKEYTEAEMESLRAKFAADPLLGEVEKEFESLMKLFAPNDPASEKNLMKLPQQLLETIRIRNSQVNEAREREKMLQKEKEDTVQSETKARQDAVAAQNKAEADLEAARVAHASAITKLNEEKQEAFNKFDAYKSDMDKRYNALAAVKNSLDATVKKQAITIDEQKEIINQFRNPDFAAPQGEIIDVANGGTTVWINLGRVDGLRVGVPFSIIDEATINTTEATKKATMVVTKLIDNDMAQAKVDEGSYSYSKPIVKGDKIYSPAWRPGRPVGFALVGMMDTNGDRRDDVEQVRELIRASGGKIDAEMDSSGVINDKLAGLSPNTSYLVTGTDVGIDTTNPDLRAEQVVKNTQYAKFMNEARSNGIQVISIDKLLGFLKTEGKSRTIPLGNRIRSEDFPIEASARPPVSNGTVSEIFQKRSPGR
jgi:hypothetical protein